MVKKIFIIIAFLVLIFSAVPYGHAAENKVYIGILPAAKVSVFEKI